MSRIAKLPVIVPTGVEVKFNGSIIYVKGKYGSCSMHVNSILNIDYIDNKFLFKQSKKYFSNYWAIAGTTRVLLYNMMVGITKRFTKILQLIGIGYRVYIKNNSINLLLGFSHPIIYQLPENVVAECPNPTEIIIKGIDKQVVGQVAADLRSYRKPELYKGKGIRYNDEVINIKEIKKK